MSQIALEGIEFFSYHGCMKEEELTGTNFRLHLYLETPTDEAELSDDLNHTVNYFDVYQLVKKEMEKRSKLLEHVGRRVIDSILSNYHTVSSVKIKIEKLNPPLGGKMESVSLTLFGNRSKSDKVLRSKPCAKCGTYFECYGDKDCWCDSIKLSEENLQFLRETYADCLCPSCLSQYAEK